MWNFNAMFATFILYLYKLFSLKIYTLCILKFKNKVFLGGTTLLNCLLSNFLISVHLSFLKYYDVNMKLKLFGNLFCEILFLSDTEVTAIDCIINVVVGGIVANFLHDIFRG